MSSTWPAISSALRDIGVRAPVGVEVFSDALHATGARAAAAAAADATRRVLGAAGGPVTMTHRAAPGRSLGAVVVGTGFGCYCPCPGPAPRRLRRPWPWSVATPRGPPSGPGCSRCPSPAAPSPRRLALPGVDAVTIATPPHTHAELALEAIAAGRHVLCEKPFARDTAEGRAVLAAAERAGIVHLLGTEFRFDAGQALLARGRARRASSARPASPPGSCTSRCSSTPTRWCRRGGPTRRPGGGWLGAHGSQLIDQIRATLGDFAGRERVAGPRRRHGR